MREIRNPQSTCMKRGFVLHSLLAESTPDTPILCYSGRQVKHYLTIYVTKLRTTSECDNLRHFRVKLPCLRLIGQESELELQANMAGSDSLRLPDMEPLGIEDSSTKPGTLVPWIYQLRKESEV